MRLGVERPSLCLGCAPAVVLSVPSTAADVEAVCLHAVHGLELRPEVSKGSKVAVDWD